jgi:uncharacterized protein (DUF169 family)
MGMMSSSSCQNNQICQTTGQPSPERSHSLNWRGYSTEIKRVLALTGSPIAVSYSMMSPAGTNGQRRSVCQALLHARSGNVVSLSKDSCNCPGGAWHLGLEPRPSDDIYMQWEEFLINGEKLFCSPASIRRTLALTTPPPLGRADHVIFSPLEKAEQMPDLVVFLCNPEQACRLVTLATYPEGRPPKLEMAGSTCHMVIAYPLVTGEMNVSLLDYASRKYQDYEPGELFVTVPYDMMAGLMWSLDRCSAGTAVI